MKLFQFQETFKALFFILTFIFPLVQKVSGWIFERRPNGGSSRRSITLSKMTAMGQISKPASRIKQAEVFMDEGKIDNRPRSPNRRLNSRRQQDQTTLYTTRSTSENYDQYRVLRSSSKTSSKRRGISFKESDYKRSQEKKEASILWRRSSTNVAGDAYG